MAKVSLELIQKLRERTGVGMMDCRKALEETGGDLEEAVTLLRKKGIAVAAKRSENATENGLVEAFVSDAFASLVEIGCETDFSARTDAMKNFAKLAAKTAAADLDLDNLENLMVAQIPDLGLTVKTQLDELIAKICENIKIASAKNFKLKENSVAASYVHPDNSVACMIELESDCALSAEQKEKVQTGARELCMQIAVSNPLVVRSSELSPEIIEKEKETARGQLAQTTKPESMWDKIIEGKLKKFYEDVCLLNQKFIKDDSITVEQKVEALAKQLGCKLSVVRFARIGIKR